MLFLPPAPPIELEMSIIVTSQCFVPSLETSKILFLFSLVVGIVWPAFDIEFVILKYE